jgi:excisionase family DNA binding protein
MSVSTDDGIERHLRMAEAARVLGVSRATLYRWLPQIKHRRIPAGGLTREVVLIPASALEAFLAQHDQIPEAEAVR